jgi:hypothetical protein
MHRCLGVPCLLDRQVLLTEGCRNWKKRTMLEVLCRLVGFWICCTWFMES